jgi:hypothetical protein
MRPLAYTTLLACLLAGCAVADDATPQPDAPPAAAVAAASLVRAEALPGGRLRVSITAREDSLSIANCNRHIVVTLLTGSSGETVWGGESDACLSPPVIVPERATLGFEVVLGAGASGLDRAAPYRARVLGVSMTTGESSSRALTDDEATSGLIRLLP